METKKYICLEDYINDEELVCFKEGYIYTFSKNRDWYRTEMNNQGYSHKLDESDINLYFREYKKQKIDSIVESVVNQFKERSEVGIKKYNTTLDRTDLSTLDWINHAQQEAMDFVLYLEKLKKEYDN